MGLGSIVLIALVVIGIYGVVVFNGLVSRRNQFKNAFSQIDVQLQRRYELIPGLIEIAKKYISHENETLTAVVKARNNASDCCEKAAQHPEDSSLVGALAQAEQVLGNAMGKFNLVMEDYPELKADESLRDLHDQLTSTENRVAYARQAYSDSVMQTSEPAAQQPIKVSFA